MELILNKKPQGATIIEGFPGMGLVGTISTEFLTNHLQCEEIGQIIIEDTAPVVAIHEEKLVKPISIFYNADKNLIIIHSISPGTKAEWAIGGAIMQLAETTKAKEILSMEGVVSQGEPSEEVFFFSNSGEVKQKLAGAGLTQLKEGIVMGVTAALLTNMHKTFTSMFAETHADMPDSRAAARMIEALDKYLGLEVNYEPLIKQAELFEAKIQNVVSKGQEATKMQRRKQISYVG